jgi:hypothetical protein
MTGGLGLALAMAAFAFAKQEVDYRFLAATEI